MAKEWYFSTSYLAFVCIEMETGFTSMFHECFQVCIVVSEVTTIDGDVISDDGYSREISKSFMNFLLKDVLGAYQTKGKPYRNRYLP